MIDSTEKFHRTLKEADQSSRLKIGGSSFRRDYAGDFIDPGRLKRGRASAIAWILSMFLVVYVGLLVITNG